MNRAFHSSLRALDSPPGGPRPSVLPKPVRPDTPKRNTLELLSRPARPISTTQPRDKEINEMSASPPRPSARPQFVKGSTSGGPRFTIAVVGDVHDQWNEESAAALASLNVDAAVFVGDFGNENVELVRQIASVTRPERKAVMLGNHDAWFSLTKRGKHRAVRVSLMSSSLRALSAASSGTAVDEMLDALGPCHIGFSSATFPELKAAFVGGRPFSKGGKRWDDVADFYSKMYGVGSMEESAHRILDETLSVPSHMAVVVVAHNGPLGLGQARHSPCGVDWQLPVEDFGDPDLAEALQAAAAAGRPAALVLFGHMHHSLKGGGRRDMAHVDPGTGTVYLNAAVVPRVKKINTEGGSTVRGHHFLLVEMEGGVVVGAKNVWAASAENMADRAGDSEGASSSGGILVAEELIKVTAAGDGSGRRVVSYYRASSDEWAPVVLEGEDDYDDDFYLNAGENAFLSTKRPREATAGRMS